MALNFPNWITAEIYTNVIYCLEALLSPKILDDFGEVLSNYLKSNITYQPLDIACLFLLDLASVPPEIPVLGVILRSPAESGTTKNLFVTGILEILRGVHPESIEGLRLTLGSFRMDAGYLWIILRVADLRPE